MVTRDEVIWAFRYCLGREPEDEVCISKHSGFESWNALRHELLRSSEFLSELGHPLDKWVIVPVMDETRLMWILLGDRNISIECLYDNYDPAGTKFVKTHLQESNVFLDLGANVGWYTLLASTIVGPSGHIHAFEPRGETKDYLSKTILLNQLGGLVTLHEKGISDVNEKGVLSWGRGTENPGSSFVTVYPSAGDFVRQPIDLITIDDLKLPRVDFIKLDIEGSEPKAIGGAAQLLARDRPIMLCELNPIAMQVVSSISPNDFLARLTGLGYRAFIVDRINAGQEITTVSA